MPPKTSPASRSKPNSSDGGRRMCDLSVRLERKKARIGAFFRSVPANNANRRYFVDVAEDITGNG
jgi:hypothetical protein